MPKPNVKDKLFGPVDFKIQLLYNIDVGKGEHMIQVTVVLVDKKGKAHSTSWMQEGGLDTFQDIRNEYDSDGWETSSEATHGFFDGPAFRAIAREGYYDETHYFFYLGDKTLDKLVYEAEQASLRR